MAKTYFFLFAFFVFSSLANADLIYFKNNRQVKGKVVLRTDKTVSIDIGGGTLTFDLNEIEKIEQSSSLLEADSPKTTSVVLRKQAIGVLVSKLRNKRLIIRRHTQERTKIQRQMKSIEEELVEIYSKYSVLSKDIQQYDAKNYGKKIKIELSNKINLIVSDIKQKELKLKELDRDNEELSKKISSFQAELSIGVLDLQNIYNEAIRKDGKEKHRQVKKMIDRFNRQWVVRKIPLRQYGTNFIVDVRLNEKMTVPLIVDTGASTVCISRKTASALGITSSDIQRKITVTLANGQQIQGSVINLDAVELGAMRSENISAVILDSSPASHAEGLLGMSFLKNYVCRINALAKQLILEKIK